MDLQRGGSYDPSQPWAVTDALLGILARTVLKSTYQTRLSAEAQNHEGPSQSGPNLSRLREPSQPTRPTAVSSQFWAGESKPAGVALNRVSANRGYASGSAGGDSTKDLSATHHALPGPSQAVHESSDIGTPSGYQSLTQAHTHHTTTSAIDDSNNKHGAANDAQGSTPSPNNSSVSPMMIDPNLATWQGEGQDDHEHESFLHQYSDMGGDYAAVPQTMIDPNLALMHEHDDFRHDRHLDDGHLDEFEGGHRLSIPSARYGRKRTLNSPFFASESPTKHGQQPSPRRRQRGTVSCIPFPQLTAPCFGLIQEQLAHDPFWLLVAVTFLIRTTGKAAIPVFWQVMQRFPSPAMLGDEANIPDLTDMIRHLGLASNRVAAIRRYANAWIKQPPQANVRYRVKGYATRNITTLSDIDPASPEHRGADIAADPSGTRKAFSSLAGQTNRSDGGKDALAQPADEGDLEAWEIGHMTQGRYAIDSWRIFCRDVLLERALDWKGSGREAEFQPEWMRVLPQDKELRAYLRWMWMKEGWQWDAVSGERKVLSEEMRVAVEEGRVAYNDDGELETVGGEQQLMPGFAGL